MPSSVIRDFRYLPAEGQLEVTFTSGRRYRYRDVPETLYLHMRASLSKGAFFNTFVRDQFAFQRVDRGEATKLAHSCPQF